MSNEKVVEAWVKGKKAHSLNMSTDGKNIFSYWLRVGKTSKGKKIGFDYRKCGGWFVFMTTSKHVSYTLGKSDIVLDNIKNKQQMSHNFNYWNKRPYHDLVTKNALQVMEV
tara:strand:- start:2722 stop:3054 length:333 start_codon:yes stop_codon:yes gene_type:complete